MKRVFKILFAFFALTSVGLTAFVTWKTLRTYDAPLPNVRASTEPAVIERGRYLVYGPAHCTECHGPADAARPFPAGQEVALEGGYTFELPIGKVRAANLTSDPDTGIGKMTDAELARSLRFGVGRNHKALMPFMPFANLSDDDLTAIISYLRTQKPVRHAVRQQELNLLGRVIGAFVLEPVGPSRPTVASLPREPTARYGEYLATSVANCNGCHTERNLMTGGYVGAMFSGGHTMGADKIPGRTFVTPNLTPHEATGRIAQWNEETFIERFRLGRGPDGTHMPWAGFSTMHEDDLRAIYRFLRTLPPIEKDTGVSVRDAEPQATVSR
jgi:mono/diheme cytochrome c family protein